MRRGPNVVWMFDVEKPHIRRQSWAARLLRWLVRSELLPWIVLVLGLVAGYAFAIARTWWLR